MKRVLTTLVALLLQTTLTGQSQQSSGVASIEGFVVKVGTSEPVARAEVILAAGTVQNTGSFAATTDGGGKFTLSNVRPGTYRLFAARDGYVRAEHGQRTAGQTGLPVTLVAGQELKDVLIPMTPTGAIAGHVYDRYGAPVVNAVIRAMKFLYADGQRSLGEFQTTSTNDLGEYRLYWLEPGQYVVSVSPPQGVRAEGDFVVIDGGPGSSVRLNGGIPSNAIRVNGTVASALGYVPPPDAAQTCLPVYFPGTTDPSMAAMIDLLPGANFTGVDLTLTDTRAARITGQAVNGITGQVIGSQVGLVSRRGNAVAAASRNSATGVGRPFDFRCVAPGAYDLVTTMNPPPSPVRLSESGNIIRTDSSNTSQTRFFARVPIDVGTADIENVTLVLQPGFRVTGRLAVEGTPPGQNHPALAGMRVELRLEGTGPQVSSPPVVVAADGTFAVNNIGLGEYRLRVVVNAFKGFVKSARLGGVDVLNVNFRLDNAPEGQLEILISTNAGTLNVGVLDDRQQPARNVTVALVPDAPHRQAFELYRNASTDASGRLRFDNISPGNYKVFAWEQVEFSAWQYPDFIRRYETFGVPISISEGGTENVAVNLITATR